MKLKNIVEKFGPTGLGVLVLLCQRMPELAVHPVWMWIAQAVIAACLTFTAKKHARWAVLVFCVVISTCSWLWDLSDGAESVIMAIAFFVMAECIMRLSMQMTLVRALLSALAATLAMQLGLVLVLAIGREMTIGGALVYAFSRHWTDAAAFFVGAQTLWLGGAGAR